MAEVVLTAIRLRPSLSAKHIIRRTITDAHFHIRDAYEQEDGANSAMQQSGRWILQGAADH